jgi:hypothetical protein
MEDSTTTWYSYVSLSITTKGQRRNPEVFPVKKGASEIEYIRTCMMILNDHNVNIMILCPDWGFYPNKVFSHLHDENIPPIVPVRKQGTASGKYSG